jgi:hypothetical protein
MSLSISAGPFDPLSFQGLTTLNDLQSKECLPVARNFNVEVKQQRIYDL